MKKPHQIPRHWIARVPEAEPVASPDRGRRIALAPLSRWGFVLCTAVAVGYGLWTVYGSGSAPTRLDVSREMEFVSAPELAPRVGPVLLEPGMNPMRASLHASHAPVSSTRLDYEVSLEDDVGRPLWKAKGVLGKRGDKASLVGTRNSLARFEVSEPGEYYFRVRTTGSSTDGLRKATIELRRNVLAVDSRIPWGFGLAALACLITSFLAPRAAPPLPLEAEEDEPRRAA